MRDELTMYQLILNIATNDERILAVYMNGSRTNKNAQKDIFQDYDIVYVVNETKPFIEDKDWIKQFGTILYMQYPDENPFSEKENSYGWLMQFDDGNRLDLHVQSLEYSLKNILEDKLCRILLDKKNLLPMIPEATDADHYVVKPTEEEFRKCINEFWWCTNNLAKGLWRKEILYVQDMANFVVRPELTKMLSWKVGAMNNFKISVGKSAKYISKWLERKDYQAYLNTFFNCLITNAWSAILLMCDLFKKVTDDVASILGYTYDTNEALQAKAFLEHIRELPSDAKEIY